VVVTAMLASAPVGLTCQSFCSLSLRPPLVMFGVATSSQSWPRIRGAGRFAVNVLGEHQERISRAFAVSQADKFVDVSWHLGAGGAPLIDGALAHIQCTLHAVHDGGDHEIAIGRVLALNERADGTGPLVYFRGEYRLLRCP
jgi:3-hydroxy-9,10-secoandrosta-1,3,5(10)-triene-9,17-dione monooxygenase reductase component